MSDLFDRLEGARSSLAFKAPCRVATTANITLSGEQTIDGVSVVEEGDNDRPDRVLVKNQTDQTQNGIWIVSTGVWSRAKDFDGNNDIVDGTRVYVHSGTVGIGEYTVTSNDPIIIDTSNIVFEVAASNLATAASEAAQAAAEAAQAAAEAASDLASANSENPAFTLAFDSSTTDADPGAGEFRFNNGTLASVTEIYIDNADFDGNTISAWLDTFDDNNATTARGTIIIKGVATATAFFVGLVTGSVTDGTGYRKVTVTHVASSGTFTAGENFSLFFVAAGNTGADGTGDVSAAGTFTDDYFIMADGSSKGVKSESFRVSNPSTLKFVAFDLASVASGSTVSLGIPATGGTIQTTLTAEALGLSRGTNPQSSNYTLALSDIGKIIEMTSTGANTLTIPSTGSVAFTGVPYMNITQYGAGATTITAGSTSLNIRSRNGLVLAGQYAMATVYKRATNEWVAGGDLST